jgi:hypothetical protein
MPHRNHLRWKRTLVARLAAEEPVVGVPNGATAILGTALRCRAESQSQRVQTNEASSVALVERGSIASHRGDLRVVNTFRTFAAADNNVAFVKEKRTPSYPRLIASAATASPITGQFRN